MGKKPNVLLIISDQLSVKKLDEARAGENGLKADALIRLENEGIRFEQSYSSFPLCCPARGSIFTGLFPHNNNIVDNEEIIKIFNDGKAPLRNIPTLGSELKKAGYETAYFGKEHAGGYGWDGIDDRGQYPYTGGGFIGEGNGYDTIFTRDAVDFLKKKRDKPFYMTLSLINPHDICAAGLSTDELKNKSFADMVNFCDGRDQGRGYLRGLPPASLPSNFAAEIHEAMVNRADPQCMIHADKPEEFWKQYISTYHLLIEKTDWYIEMVLNTLKQQGLEENTLVVFTTDHGDMMGSHRLIAKALFYEESVKTPMVVRFPERVRPEQVDRSHFVNTVDLMPTILDFCGLELPEGLDGKSFKPLCLGAETGGFDKTFSENPTGKMLRFDNWKYTRNRYAYGDGDAETLFDLAADPEERRNRIDDLECADAAETARAEMSAWLADRGLTPHFRYALGYEGRVYDFKE